MDSRTLDLAAEFCSLVGKSNLLEYLGLAEDASPEAAQKKLKARRKYMQGMQSNPKYKSEAIFLIKSFSALSRVLETPIPYLKDSKRRAESQHLPVLEMTIKGVLAGGALTHEQEDYLRRNGLELGISEATFEDVLERLANEAGVVRATAALTITPEELKSLDFYNVLGVPRHASRDDIFARYRQKIDESKGLSDPRQRDGLRTRVEKAWKVLSDSPARQQYDLAWTRTGPPARNREVTRPKQVATAPPIRHRDADAPPSQPVLTPAKMEVLSGATQRVQIANTPITVSIEVRNSGEMPLTGTVKSDQPWLRVLTPELRPEQKQQSVRVQIDPSSVDGRSATGQVYLIASDGTTASITFDVFRASPAVLLPLAVGAGAALLVLSGIVAWQLLGGPTDFKIDVDPWGEEILVDGKLVGTGLGVVLGDPPDGTATLTIRHRNFKSWVKDVEMVPGGTAKAKLVLATKMDFVPSEHLTRAHLDQGVADAVMADFQPKLDRCLRSGSEGQGLLTGVVRIHVGRDGYTTGLEIQGQGEDSPAIVDCLRRQAAGPVFPALIDGDFATVRYAYVIPVQ